MLRERKEEKLLNSDRGDILQDRICLHFKRFKREEKLEWKNQRNIERKIQFAFHFRRIKIHSYYKRSSISWLVTFNLWAKQRNRNF